MTRPKLHLAPHHAKPAVPYSLLKQAVRLQLARLVAFFSRTLPDALERLHLQWARAELTRYCPTHEDLPYIIHRINELERAM